MYIDPNQPCVLYRVTRKETGDGYMGISIEHDERWVRHIWEAFKNDCDTHFARALRKYGLEAFDWNVIAEFDTIPDAKDAEIFAIKIGLGHYNETRGGDGINGLSEKGRAKKSAALKGKPKSPETRARMSEAQSGRTISDEGKDSMRQARLRYLAEFGPYPMTEERRQKISVAHQGVKNSPEHCKAISEAKKGILHSESHKQNISTGMKKFYKENPEVRQLLSKLGAERKHTEKSKQKMRDSWVIRKQKEAEKNKNKQEEPKANSIPDYLNKKK